jgi:hypothetical protein
MAGAKKNVLILTDGSGSVRRMGEGIAGELRGEQVALVDGGDLSGTDILPAEFFFFGCEAPHPPSFAYLEQVLRHINLAGRGCGLFSPRSEEALRYLADLIVDAELALRGEPFLGEHRENREDLARWVRAIIT